MDNPASKREARLCRWAACFFLATAAVEAGAALLSAGMAFTPVTEFHCRAPAGCITASHPEQLLPEDSREAVVASSSALRRYRAYLARWPVRAGLATVALLRRVPFILLIGFIGGAIWRLGTRTAYRLEGASPWLRRASAAALVAAVAPAVGDSARVMLAFPGTPEGATWYAEADVSSLGSGLLLAFAAYVVSWALAAGGRAEADLAGIV